MTGAADSSWVDSTAKTGKVPEDVVALADAGLAYAGRDWARQKDAIQKLAPEQQLAEMRKLAHQSIRENPFSKKDAPAWDAKNPATHTALDAYIDNLIDRSLDKDKKEGAARGTNLAGFLEGTKEAVKDVDFDRVDKKDSMYLMGLKTSGKFEEVKKAINASAEKHIDASFKGKQLEQDLAETIQADAKKPENNKVFRKGLAADETQPMAGDNALMQLLVTFIGAILGIDLSGLFGGQKDEGAQKAADESHIAVISPQLHDKLEKLSTAAKELMKDPKKASDASLEAVADAAGIKKDVLLTLTDEQKKELGSVISDDVTKVKTHEITEQHLNADASAIVQKHGRANFGMFLEGAKSAVLPAVAGAAFGPAAMPIEMVIAQAQSMPKTGDAQAHGEHHDGGLVSNITQAVMNMLGKEKGGRA